MPVESVEYSGRSTDMPRFPKPWSKKRGKRILGHALAGEAGELAEIFQWMGDDFNAGDWEGKIRDEVGQEIADVGIYAARLLTLVGGKME